MLHVFKLKVTVADMRYFVRDHSFSKYAKPSEKLLFLTP